MPRTLTRARSPQAPTSSNARRGHSSNPYIPQTNDKPNPASDASSSGGDIPSRKDVKKKAARAAKEQQEELEQAEDQDEEVEEGEEMYVVARPMSKYTWSAVQPADTRRIVTWWRES